MVKSKFSISLHIMTLLAYYPGDWHSSANIAESININPVLVRKELIALKSNDLVESKEGKNGGVRLGKSAKNISLADIFEAVKGSSHVLNLSNNVPDVSCKIGGQINEKLLLMFDDIDNAIIDVLKLQTLENFKNQF
ncbi:Rrf2 family transcriptional regulator [uncultured Aquimarina sp.]|uniref:RrF2 family transcriptional regulator n=1 Tax=uncultured Aquimarina sp. TaxID=575652 RepID=UPI002609F55F|nr:Rrf2 family transcriptional regulator [uncultured Aquimarina sp.]